ncbi:MAG TPA: S8 family serine peptidase [Herpetosiphonaceae bacterium]
MVGNTTDAFSHAPTADSGSEILVKFHAPHTVAAVQRFAAAYDGTRDREILHIGVHVLRFPPTTNQQALLHRLRANSAVAYAETNSVATVQLIPDDPGYPNQWGLTTINAPQGWDLAQGDPAVVIAVIDTGVDPYHPDLSGKQVPGWNYDSFSPGYNTADTTDNHGHGTHVAGIAAAATNNARGIAGVCPLCRIMPVKVLGADGSGTYDAVASGILYAADHGAQVINLSLGGSASSQGLQEAVTYAASRGALLIAAAGNDGTNFPTYPAALPGVMAIAATTSSDQRAAFSNYNTYLSVAAPGVDVYSTVWSNTAGSTYAYKSGTSMATPVVSGLAGLVIAQDASRSSAAVRAMIERSADDLHSSGWDQYTGYGRVNLGRAVSGSVLGMVTDGVTGATLVNAQVEALHAGQVRATTLSQADGSYNLRYLPAGTYDIRITLAGYAPQTRNSVLVETAQVSGPVDVALTRVGSVTGKVTSGRKAVAGATVQALQGTELLGSATTDAYGIYQIANLPAGTYTLTASASGYQSQTKSGVVVNPGQTTSGVNFSLTR